MDAALRGCSVFLIAVLLSPVLHGAPPESKNSPEVVRSLVDDIDAATAAFDAALVRLAARHESAGEPKLAAEVRAWRVPSAPLTWRLALPPDNTARDAASEPPPTTDDPAADVSFGTLRARRAAELVALAERAAVARQVGLSLRLLYSALREQPSHDRARRVLGYELVDGEWLTPFEREQRRAGKTWHARFGWLPAEHLARYEKGNRFLRGRWITSEEDARAHAEIERGWVVAGEHFTVRTNHSLAEGARLVERLELLFHVWRQLFAGYTTTPEQWRARFEGPLPPARPPRRRQVVMFRNREEYLAHLQAREPRIELTSGYYRATERTAYFHAAEAKPSEGRPADPLGDDAHLFHEATHQLFSESRPVAPLVGQKDNFWVVEGVACYLESLTLEGGLARVGGVEAVRLENARRRALQEQFYVPLSDFTARGMREFQADPEISRLYSQAAGHVFWLIHAEPNRGEALVEHLRAVYTGRSRPTTLAEILATEFASLDAEYLKFLREAERLAQDEAAPR